MSGISLKQRLALELHRQLIKEQQEKHPLRQLFWECTLRCNLHCRHCGSDCHISSVGPDMPFEDFRKVLARIKERYDPHHIMVILTGGEPLMRKDLEKCGREIYGMEFPWSIVSNGMLMTPRRIESLLRAGLHAATVSLRQWRLFTVFPAGRAASDPDLQLDRERFRGLMEFISRTRKEGRIMPSYGCEGFLGEFEGKVRDHLYTCQAGLSVASVLADGSISACPSIRSDYHQGSIYEDDFIDVWENRFVPYRDRSWMKKGKCGSCRWFRYCEGNGMHLRNDAGELMLCHMDRII